MHECISHNGWSQVISLQRPTCTVVPAVKLPLLCCPGMVLQVSLEILELFHGHASCHDCNCVSAAHIS